MEKKDLKIIDSSEHFSFRELEKKDIPDIMNSWARELGEFEDQKFRNMLNERFDQKVPAFGIFENTELLGAVWCKDWKFTVPLNENLRLKAFEISNIYINSKTRGKGVGKILLSYAINSMFDSGKTIVFSRIYAERVASVKIHEGVGFYKLGRLTYGFIMGFRFNIIFYKNVRGK